MHRSSAVLARQALTHHQFVPMSKVKTKPLLHEHDRSTVDEILDEAIRESRRGCLLREGAIDAIELVLVSRNSSVICARILSPHDLIPITRTSRATLVFQTKGGRLVFALDGLVFETEKLLRAAKPLTVIRQKRSWC